MKKILIPLTLLALSVAIWAVWPVEHNHADKPLTLYGNVDIRQIALAFEGSGRITALEVEEGDTVRRGQILARLDTRTLALQAEQARADITAREQALLRLERGSRPQEIAEARAALAASAAEMAFAAQDFQRLQHLAQEQAVSLQERDRAQLRWQLTRAAHEQTSKALELVQLGPRQEERDEAAAQLQRAQASLALLEHQISLGELIAPADAVVRSRLLEVGDMANPQRLVLALALRDPKWIRVWVSEVDLGKIQPGMAAHITTDSAPDQPLTGYVGYISSVAEFTPKSVQTEELRTTLVYEVRVRVDDPHNRLRLGQPATVQFTPDYE